MDYQSSSSTAQLLKANFCGSVSTFYENYKSKVQSKDELMIINIRVSLKPLPYPYPTPTLENPYPKFRKPLPQISLFRVTS